MSVFSERLKQLRTKRKMSQQQLANVLHVSQNAVFNWENEKREPSFETVQKLADFFFVSPAFLLGWEEYLQTDTDFIAEMFKDRKNIEYFKKYLSLDSKEKDMICCFTDFLIQKKKGL